MEELVNVLLRLGAERLRELPAFDEKAGNVSTWETLEGEEKMSTVIYFVNTCDAFELYR